MRLPEGSFNPELAKVSHFTRKGHKLTGVVHVGANDGYEIQFYFALGAERVMAFEPLYGARAKLREDYGDDPDVTIWGYALGDQIHLTFLEVTGGDGKGSSFLREIDSPYQIVARQSAVIQRFDSLGCDLRGYNTLVIDVQGMELQVLKGFGEQLKEFSFLVVECSEVPMFEGEASAQEVIDYLAGMGFRQDSPIESHDDIMFIRKGLN